MTLITFKEAKENFFDRDRVQNALGRGLARGMSRIGARIRTVARRSIRPARRMRPSEMPDDMRAFYKENKEYERPFKSSEPGEAPRSRTKRLRNSIFYAFEPMTKSAVIGPIRFPGSRSEDSPRILEFGGNSTVRITKPQKKKPKPRKATAAQAEAFKRKLADGSIRRPEDPNKNAPIITYPVRIAPRPYMRPAFKLVRPSIGREFRNLLRIR